MEEQLHQQLLRLNEESAGLDARIGVAVGKIEAARAEADKEGIGLYNKIYDNLVADKKALNARRAALEAQLAGMSLPAWTSPHFLLPPSACLPRPAALHIYSVCVL